MARFTVTVTVLLFTLAFSVVSTFSVKPGNDIIDESLATISAEPDPDTTVPSLTESESTSSDEVTVPVNFVNFHPINRHFPRRPLTTASFSRRPCHHRRHELSGQELQIPFGKDMIFAGAEEATDTDHWPHDVDSDFLAIKILVHREEDGHETEGEEDDSGEVTVTRVKLIKRKGGEDERGSYNGMLGRKIRKFLNHLV